MKVLVTGGAGYIGSHVVKALGEKNHEVVVIDNLSTGFHESILYGTFYQEDLLNNDKIKEIIDKEKPDAVMHFAGSIVVPESVQNPLKYFQNNVVASLKLLQSLSDSVKYFIFSSTAAVYGLPEVIPAGEETPLAPINPYGSTKAVVEGMLADHASASSLRYVALRYFNVAGADPDSQLGEKKKDASHLITRVVRTACGIYPEIEVYGTDYDTPDGTCIRDYIHVTDLADAHLAALDYLASGGKSDIFNCGYGRGASVKEVIETAKEVTGLPIPVVYQGRRPGDSPALTANVDKIKSTLNWKPRYNDLQTIIHTAFNWEKIKITEGQYFVQATDTEKEFYRRITFDNPNTAG
jgi:UDP-glucose 4-epimerase